MKAMNPKRTRGGKKVKHWMTAWIGLRDDGTPKRRVMIDNCFAVFPTKKGAKSTSEKVAKCEIKYEFAPKSKLEVSL